MYSSRRCKITIKNKVRNRRKFCLKYHYKHSVKANWLSLTFEWMKVFKSIGPALGHFPSKEIAMTAVFCQNLQVNWLFLFSLTNRNLKSIFVRICGGAVARMGRIYCVTDLPKTGAWKPWWRDLFRSVLVAKLRKTVSKQVKWGYVCEFCWNCIPEVCSLDNKTRIKRC